MKDSELYLKHEKLTQEIFNAKNMLPSRYVLVLTNLCNLRCSFCFQEKKYSKNNLNATEWIDIIKQFPEYSRVTLTGGEPLVFEGFKDIFHEVASRFDCNIISNGMLLTKELIDFLLSYKNFKTLSISIDTIGNINRGVTSEEWSTLKDMLKYFIQRRDKLNKNCKLDIKTTVLDENTNELYAVHKYCLEELNADFHSFQLLKGSPIQHADIEYNYPDIFKGYQAHSYKNFNIIKEQFDLVRDYNIKKNKIGFVHPKVTSLVEKDDTNYDFINDTFHDSNKFELCKAAWSSLHINYDGKVFPCLAVSMGNLKENKLKEIVFDSKFNQFKKDIEKHKTLPACNRCGWLKPVIKCIK
ncbi:MAG: radical SAM protein [Campylobacterota bacterium]|nr:radical SAM protein [Campylobacterota bacterium]